jgi:hypothetical protein
MLSLCVMLGYYCLTDLLADPMLDIPSLYHSVSWKWCDVSFQTCAEQTMYCGGRASSVIIGGMCSTCARSRPAVS